MAVGQTSTIPLTVRNCDLSVIDDQGSVGIVNGAIKVWIGVWIGEQPVIISTAQQSRRVERIQNHIREDVSGLTMHQRG